MLFALIGSALLAAAADPPPAKEPPAKKELFAKEDWYKGQPGKEQDFVGVLRYAPRGKGAVGFGRFNPFRLEFEGKNGFREVYVGGKEDLLKDYVGRRVKLTGKAVDMEVEGRMHREIWPARVELLPAKKPSPKESPANPAPNAPLALLAPAPADRPADKAPAVIARSPARIGVRGGEPAQLVIRSAEELAKAMGTDAETASAQAARMLKVEKIDWSKQMLLVVSAGTRRTGGYRVEVTDLTLSKDGTLTVKWKLNTPRPGGPVTQAITHPAQTLLVDRFEGKVNFDPPAPKKLDAPPVKLPARELKPRPGSTLPVIRPATPPAKPEI